MKDRGYHALGYAVWHGRKLLRRREQADVRRKVLAGAVVALVVVAGALTYELTESA